ncbi:DUF2478 domain-containing protein [Candidatus Sumerlaeota bacterium]|nr:DUF2478 domain-containing protein [Candidatus Sumerlaeota bacterium]
MNSGKSRWAKALVSLLKENTSITIGGIINNAIFENNVKIGYLCESLLTGATEVFARRSQKKENDDDIICGQWVILSKGMRFAQQALLQAHKEHPDLVVIDEFGLLEKDGKGLRNEIDKIVSSSNNVLIVVRKPLLYDITTIYGKTTPQIIDIEKIGTDEEAVKNSMPYKCFAEKNIHS